MSVQDELKEGIYEVYSNFYDVIQFYPFDPLNSKQDDIYGECTEKFYKDPIGLLAKPSGITPKETDVDSSRPLNSLRFTIPLKSFELGGIDVNPKELEKGRIIFNGTVYKINSVEQSLNIQGAFLCYNFDCEEDRR